MPISITYAKECGWGDRAAAFSTWYGEVEKAFEARVGIPIMYILGDWNAADLFEDESCVERAVDELLIAIEEEGFDLSLL